MVTQPRRIRSIALITAAMTLAAILLPTSCVLADTAPQTPTTPQTVTADALPTVQVDGVVWSQLVVGNTVFVGGRFDVAYPAGVKKGVDDRARTDLLAYDLQSGELVDGFAPVLNGQVRALAASADGRTVFAGGDFTMVNGAPAGRIVALDSTTGATRSGFSAKAGASVAALAADGSTLYAGGEFTSVNGAKRQRLAALSTTTGKLLSWKVAVADGWVRALVVSPDRSRIAIGGNFSQVNGTAQRGLAMVDTSTGTKTLPFAANQVVQDYGVNSSILSLWGDATGIYGSGYVYGTPGDLEGTFRATWSGGKLVWLEDCHGDTYSIAVSGGVAYTASHAHYCGNVPHGFMQTRSAARASSVQRALAFTTSVEGTLSKNAVGAYHDFGGQPAPELLAWYPDLTTGTASGSGQAAWSVAVAKGYVLYGGEFPAVNGVRQAGLVRFALPSTAPDAQGPRLSGSKWQPTAFSPTSGVVRLGWQTNWDRDNENLSYRVYRDGGSDPVYSTNAASDGWWKRPWLSFVDVGLPVGSTPTYTVTATDPSGNTVTSAPATTQVSNDAPSPYADAVLASGAVHYWRFGAKDTGGVVHDWAGATRMVIGPDVRIDAPGAIVGDANGSGSFPGTDTGVGYTDQFGPSANTFSVEAWFKTSSRQGGSLLGYGNLQTSASEWTDRTVYMDKTGQLHFGVKSPDERAVGTMKGYNDGKWHQVVATLGAGGMRLFVDGALAASNPKVTSGQRYGGYWHVGGNPAFNGTQDFAGAIAEVALYPTAVSSTVVAQHWLLGSTGTP